MKVSVCASGWQFVLEYGKKDNIEECTLFSYNNSERIASNCIELLMLMEQRLGQRLHIEFSSILCHTVQIISFTVVSVSSQFGNAKV